MENVEKTQKPLTRAVRIKTGPERATEIEPTKGSALSIPWAYPFFFSFIGLAACHGKAQNESKPHSSHTALFYEGKGA